MYVRLFYLSKHQKKIEVIRLSWYFGEKIKYFIKNFFFRIFADQNKFILIFNKWLITFSCNVLICVDLLKCPMTWEYVLTIYQTRISQVFQRTKKPNRTLVINHLDRNNKSMRKLFCHELTTEGKQMLEPLEECN